MDNKFQVSHLLAALGFSLPESVSSLPDCPLPHAHYAAATLAFALQALNLRSIYLLVFPLPEILCYQLVRWMPLRPSALSLSTPQGDLSLYFK